MTFEMLMVKGDGGLERTAARVMTKAALLEHIDISESWLMIFLTRDTEFVSWDWGLIWVRLTWELSLSRGLLSRRDGTGVVRHDVR